MFPPSYQEGADPPMAPRLVELAPPLMAPRSSRCPQVYRPGLFGNENRYILFVRREISHPLTLRPRRIKQRYSTVVVIIFSTVSFAPVIEDWNLTARPSPALPALCSQVNYSRKLVGSTWLDQCHRSAELAAVQLSYDRHPRLPASLCLDGVSDGVAQRGSAHVLWSVGQGQLFGLFVFSSQVRSILSPRV